MPQLKVHNFGIESMVYLFATLTTDNRQKEIDNFAVFIEL